MEFIEESDNVIKPKSSRRNAILNELEVAFLEAKEIKEDQLHHCNPNKSAVTMDVV